MVKVRAGIKRSASGDAAPAAAKKQKTTPLAAYQQAQEHLRSHTPRHVCSCHPCLTGLLLDFASELLNVKLALWQVASDTFTSWALPTLLWLPGVDTYAFRWGELCAQLMQLEHTSNVGVAAMQLCARASQLWASALVSYTSHILLFKQPLLVVNSPCCPLCLCTGR